MKYIQAKAGKDENQTPSNYLIVISRKVFYGKRLSGWFAALRRFRSFLPTIHTSNMTEELSRNRRFQY